ncbi:hypothetical protein C1H46_010983 [Malus baccata]|uniref:Uncharacterized protein n=1 Tax=Malus baccata TaxID=106549 RepID=A0A540MXB7_MALBA|nr:hypothetical protein C1H46_010983 [Malus baccata]
MLTITNFSSLRYHLCFSSLLKIFGGLSAVNSCKDCRNSESGELHLFDRFWFKIEETLSPEDMDMDGEDPIDGTAGTEAPISSLAQGPAFFGVVNMLVMASNHHGIGFTIVDTDKLKIEACDNVWNGVPNAALPFEEPRLRDLLNDPKHSFFFFLSNMPNTLIMSVLFGMRRQKMKES